MKEFFTKIYNWIKSHKILVLFIVSVTSAGILIYFLQPKGQVPVLTLNPSPSPIETREILKRPNVYPQPGTASIADTDTAIALFFDTVVDPSTVIISSTPNVLFEIKSMPDYPTRLILVPREKWKEGHYKITIQRGLLSLPGDREMRSDLIIEYDVTKTDTEHFGSPV